MIKNDAELIATIDSLPADARASLANHIWQSLHAIDSSIEESWVREADRRWKDYRQGKSGSISHSEFKKRYLK